MASPRGGGWPDPAWQRPASAEAEAGAEGLYVAVERCPLCNTTRRRLTCARCVRGGDFVFFDGRDSERWVPAGPGRAGGRQASGAAGGGAGPGARLREGRARARPGSRSPHPHPAVLFARLECGLPILLFLCSALFGPSPSQPCKPPWQKEGEEPRK